MAKNKTLVDPQGNPVGSSRERRAKLEKSALERKLTKLTRDVNEANLTVARKTQTLEVVNSKLRNFDSSYLNTIKELETFTKEFEKSTKTISRAATTQVTGLKHIVETTRKTTNIDYVKAKQKELKDLQKLVKSSFVGDEQEFLLKQIDRTKKYIAAESKRKTKLYNKLMYSKGGKTSVLGKLFGAMDPQQESILLSQKIATETSIKRAKKQQSYLGGYISALETGDQKKIEKFEAKKDPVFYLKRIDKSTSSTYNLLKKGTGFTGGTGNVGSYSKLGIASGENSGSILGTMFKTFMKVPGLLLSAAGMLTSGIIGVVKKAFSFDFWTKILEGVVAALGAAFVYYNWDKIKPILEKYKVFEYAQKAADVVKDYVISPIANGIMKASDVLLDTLIDLGGAVGDELWEGTKNWAGDVETSARRWFLPAVQSSVSTLEKYLIKANFWIGGKLLDVGLSLASKMKRWWNSAKNILDRAWNSILNTDTTLSKRTRMVLKMMPFGMGTGIIAAADYFAQEKRSPEEQRSAAERLNERIQKRNRENVLEFDKNKNRPSNADALMSYVDDRFSAREERSQRSLNRAEYRRLIRSYRRIQNRNYSDQSVKDSDCLVALEKIVDFATQHNISNHLQEFVDDLNILRSKGVSRHARIHKPIKERIEKIDKVLERPMRKAYDTVRDKMFASGINPETLAALRKYADLYGVDVNDVIKITGIESWGGNQFNKNGSVVTSEKGALGAMQLMPDTAKDLGVDPTVLDDNVKGGVKYWKQLLDRYNGDKTMAAAAYNWGMGNLEKYGLSGMPEETRNYLAKFNSGEISSVRSPTRPPSDDLENLLTLVQQAMSSMTVINAPSNVNNNVNAPSSSAYTSSGATTDADLMAFVMQEAAALGFGR